MIKKEIRWREPKTTKSEGLMWVEVGDGEGGKIFIAVVYMAPGWVPSVKEVNQQLMDELNEDISLFREQGKFAS